MNKLDKYFKNVETLASEFKKKIGNLKIFSESEVPLEQPENFPILLSASPVFKNASPISKQEEKMLNKHKSYLKKKTISEVRKKTLVLDLGIFKY